MPVRTKFSLIQKLVCIMAVLLLVFFVLIGIMAHTVLEKQVLFNTENSISLLTASEGQDFTDYFKHLENLGLKSSDTILKWLDQKVLLSELERFDKKYSFIKGAIRTDLNAFSDQDISAVFVSSRSTISDDLKKIILATEGNFEEYARGIKTFVFNMYLITRHQMIRIYEKDWALEIEADHDFSKDVFYFVADPDHNPERKPKWTAPYYDSIWKHWMTSLITPIYKDDNFLGIVGHDVILDDIYNKILNKKIFKSGYSFIFDKNKNIIIHPHYLDRLLQTAKMGTYLSFGEIDSPEASAAISRVVGLELTDKTIAHEKFTENGGFQHLYAYKLDFLDWYFGIVIPQKEVVRTLGEFQKRFIFGAVLVSVILFLAIILVLWFLIVSPIGKLTSATQAIQTGDFGEIVNVQSRDEIGELSKSFNNMSDKLGRTLKRLKQDIKVRKLAEEALQESEEKYRTTLEANPDPVVVYDMDGKVVYLNPSFTRVFGWTLEEQIGKKIDNFVPEKNWPETKVMIEKVAAGERVPGKETRRLKKEGKVIPVSVSASCYRDQEGDVIGSIVNLRDISAYKRIEEDLKKSKNEAEIMAKEAKAANIAKSEFLANMSHEIRTPMNAIMGMTELVLGTNLAKEQRDNLKTVLNSSESLLSLVNDFLDFSKIEAGHLKLEKIEFDLYSAIEGVADMMVVKAREKGLELTYHVKPDVSTQLIGDPGRLRQTLVNLVGNAIKFTERGAITIEVATEEEFNTSACLHFSVSDTGVGIPASKIESIFKSFIQADGSVTRKYGGTGLGLTISKQIVEAMGGRIWVESGSGRGSVFQFTAEFELNRSVVTKPLFSKKTALLDVKVLIVDDNRTNRTIFKEMVAFWGLNSKVASSGTQAVSMIEEAFESGDPIRLLLLDAQMPEMDGFEVARTVKKKPYGKDIEIILLTSSGQKGDAMRCQDIGISGYLLKPTKKSELLDTILMVLGASDDEKAQIVTRFKIKETRRQLNILLAEDNIVNQKLAVKMLEKRGHQTVIASNGQEAIRLYENGNYDLILMDVQMPEMDGLETTKLIREKEGQTDEHIPIIAMTAHTMKGDKKRCLSAGMDGYISKPIKFEDLFKLVEEYGSMKFKGE